MSLLLYGCTRWTLTKHSGRKLDGNCRRMLRAVLNKSWRQYLTKQQLYGHLPLITKTIQTRRARHAGHWRGKGDLINNVHQWTPSHGQVRVGRPARTYQQQLCTDTGSSIKDLPRARDDRDEWRERVREIRASSTPWLWYIYIYIYLYIYIYIYIYIYLLLLIYTKSLANKKFGLTE